MCLAERTLISFPLVNNNENKQRSKPIRARRRNKQPAANDDNNNHHHHHHHHHHKIYSTRILKVQNRFTTAKKRGVLHLFLETQVA